MFVLVACRSRREAADVVPVAARDASMTTARDARTGDSTVVDAERDAAIDPERLQAFCRARADANERVYRRATRHADCPGEGALHVHAAMARCAITGRGAWAIELRDLHATEGAADQPTCEGNWDLVFSDGGGTEIRAADGEAPFAWRQEPARGVVPGALLASDLDDDGVPEALVRTRVSGQWASDSNWTIVTVHGGAVVPFSPVADLIVTDVEDLDHDGRLDLVTPGPYVAHVEDNVEITGPPLLAHTVGDGTFAFDDALARGFARRHCPRRAREVVVRRSAPDGGASAGSETLVGVDLDLEATGRRAVCARIAGATVRDVLDQLAVVCATYAPRDRDAGAATAPGACPGFLRAWASTTPPVTFAPMR